MNKTKIPDVKFLTFECSGQDVKCYFGSFTYNNVFFTFKFTEQVDYPDRHLRGSITAKDRVGNSHKIKKINNSGESTIKYITCERRIYTHDPKEIKEKIAKAVRRLYSKYALDLQSDLFESLRPDTITPVLAVGKHGKAYVDYNHNAACEESKEQYYRRLQRAAEKMPEMPMCQITTTLFNKWHKTNTFTKSQLKEMQKFWKYCLYKRICVGENPIHIARAKKRKKSDKRSVVKIDKLLPEQEQELYDYIDAHVTGPHMGTILALGGGFMPAQIVELKWSDITIEADTYVIVHDYIAERSGATKDYKRPLMPQAARIIIKRYMELLQEHTPRKISRMPVVSSKKDPTKKYNVDALKKDTERLVTKYVRHEILKQISNEDLDYAAAFKILHNTYEYDLNVRCSLKKNSGVYNFMMRKSLLGDVTSDSYRDFTSKAASRHMHELTMFLDKEIFETDLVSTAKEGATTVKTLRPETNHCTINGYVELILPPKAKSIIESRYGVEGNLEVKSVKGKH